MSVQAIQPGPVWPVVGGIIYALPGTPCEIILGATCERSNIYSGHSLHGQVGTNHVGGFVRPTTNTTIQALKIKMDGLAYTPGSTSPIINDAGSYSAKILKDKPSYYWNLNETSGLIAYDSVGGAHGTISGGVTLNQSGAVGKGMLFDGVDGNIIDSSCILHYQPFTIEAWVKSTFNS